MSNKTIKDWTMGVGPAFKNGGTNDLLGRDRAEGTLD